MVTIWAVIRTIIRAKRAGKGFFIYMCIDIDIDLQ